MIKIKSVEWRNFLSYGDYLTIIDYSRIGCALITGTIDDPDNLHRSNGAGKTTIVEAIIWCLFGRTSNKSRPGDRVINWRIGKNCLVRITTEDGYKITRTRKMQGHDDLLVHMPDGTDISSGTNPVAQEHLQRIFNLDYGVFTSSVFFGQASMSFLELPDKKRRTILEKILRVDHLETYAQVATEKCESVESGLKQAKDQVEKLQKKIQTLKSKYDVNSEREQNFETERESEIRRAKVQAMQEDESYLNVISDKHNRISDVGQRLSNIIQISDEEIKALSEKWGKINKVEAIISSQNSDMSNTKADILVKNRELKKAERDITNWTNKAGNMCSNCMQLVSGDHVDSLTKPLEDQALLLKSELTDLHNRVDKLTEKLQDTQTRLESAKPKQTVVELTRKKAEITRKQDDIKTMISEAKQEIVKIEQMREQSETRSKQQIETIKKRDNPYVAIGRELYEESQQAETDFQTNLKKSNQDTILLKHLEYIKSAYRDRKKIRAHILMDWIPYLNKQLRYYLRSFGVPMDIESNAYLQHKSSMWDYDMCSGGERKRIDLACMLSLYDLHTAIYGLPCNILVFDEVDGKLDEAGIETFIRIITDDFSKKQDKPDAILVISHRDEMRDAFPTKIEVRKGNEFSQLEHIN